MFKDTNASPAEGTKMKATWVKIAGVVLVGAGLAWATEVPSLWDGAEGPPSGPGDIETFQLQGSIIDLCTFEGGTQNGLINPENGGLIEGTASGMRFPAPWRTLTSGGYANNPSGVTIAYWPGGTENFAEVTFDVPVASVGFYYASAVDVTLQAFGACGALLASATGPANYVEGEVFMVWSHLSLEVNHNTIARVRITGASGWTGIDDFQTVIVTAPPPITAEIDLKPENYPNDVDPFNLNSNKPVEACVFSTADFDALDMCLATVELGDPTLPGTVAALSASPEDVNGDGLMDVVFDFGLARDLGDAGALDEFSMEVLLTGLTSGGAEVFGFDEVNIVGAGNG